MGYHNTLVKINFASQLEIVQVSVKIPSHQIKLFNVNNENMAGNSQRDQRSNLRANSSFSCPASVEVTTTSMRLANTRIVADRMKKSSRVKYDTLGKSAPTANRYAIRVSMVVMATLIWIPDSLGSIQNTIQDMATIRISGRLF